jgi:glutaredoxin
MAEIKVIGTIGCSRCVMTKNVLTNKGIEFDYILLNSLPQDEQDRLLDLATKKNLMNFPLIIKNDEAITLQEV